MKAKKNNFDYFDCFTQYTACACKAAELLDNIVNDFDSAKFLKQKDEIHKIENEADSIKHVAMERLIKEFITPIEREDIVQLLQELDNVVDAIDDIVGHLYMFNVSKIKSSAKELSKLVVKTCKALDSVAVEFKNFKKSDSIKQNMILVDTCEAEGDTLHIECIRKLFSEESSTIDIIVWKDIYECFESCFDCCEHAVNLMQSIIMKNS